MASCFISDLKVEWEDVAAWSSDAIRGKGLLPSMEAA